MEKILFKQTPLTNIFYSRVSSEVWGHGEKHWRLWPELMEAQTPVTHAPNITLCFTVGTFQANTWDWLHIAWQLVSHKAQPFLASSRREVQGMNQKEKKWFSENSTSNVGYAKDKNEFQGPPEEINKHKQLWTAEFHLIFQAKISCQNSSACIWKSLFVTGLH